MLGRVLRPYSARAARPTEALFAHAADVRELAERWPALAEHLRTQSGGVVQELREWRERVAAKQEAGADALHHTQPADAAAEGSMDGSASSGLDSWEGSGAGSGIAIATHWQASALPLTSMPALEVEGGSGDASPVTPAPRSLHQRLRDLLGRRPRESVVTNAAHRVSFAQAVPVRNSRPRAASPSPASPGVRPSGQVRTPASVASAVSESTPTEQSFGFLRRRSRRSTAPPCRVRPTAPGKLLWDVVMAVQALLVALAAPLRLSLRLTNTPLLLALDAVTDVWFAADMALTFFTGVPDKQETIVWSARAIARQYVTSWLLFDCLSLLPLLLLLVAPDAGQPTVRPLAVTLQLLRLLRLSRLTRVLARFRRAAEMVPPTVVQVCKLLATLLMVAHVMTCAWLAVTDGDVEGSWLHTYCVEEGCNATPAARYLTALYWTITTYVRACAAPAPALPPHARARPAYAPLAQRHHHRVRRRHAGAGAAGRGVGGHRVAGGGLRVLLLRAGRNHQRHPQPGPRARHRERGHHHHAQLPHGAAPARRPHARHRGAVPALHGGRGRVQRGGGGAAAARRPPVRRHAGGAPAGAGGGARAARHGERGAGCVPPRRVRACAPHLTCRIA